MQVALERRVELVRRQDVEDDQLGAGRGELADDPVGRRIEQVGQEDHDAAAVELGRRVPGGRERGPSGPSAASMADRSASSRNTRPEPRNAVRRRAIRPDSAVTRTRSSLASPMYPRAAAARLANRSFDGRAVRHRRRRVDQQADRHVLFLDEELDEQLLEPGVDVPVELAQVVAGRVVAIVGELDGLAALDAPPPALQAAADRRRA